RKVGEIFYRSGKEGVKMVDNFMKENKRWIIEGVFPVWKVFEEAEVIIFMKPFFLTPVFRQWRRFFADEFQRKTFGFKTNFTFLTPDIMRQYFSNRGCSDLKDPTTFSIKKYELMLASFEKKILKVGVINYNLQKDILKKIVLNGETKSNVR
ncbi:MAG: hypothetical protein WC784_00360, partial [Candidatus Shapirobacteria bacterium]